MKIGDKVTFLKYDISNWQSSQSVGWGYVFYIDEDVIGCARKGYSPTYIKNNSDSEMVFKINENTKETMLKLLDNQISMLREKVKTLTSSEKDELIKNEFERIKLKISQTAKNMIESDNETSYINRLKEICEIKKKLFSIKVADLENVHKSNGAILFKIKQLYDLKNRIIIESFD